MIPVILTAGRGRRVGEETADRPKWFLDVGGHQLYEYQLAALSSYFDTAYVILGHGFTDENELMPSDIGGYNIDISFEVYPDWRETENAGTAAFALDRIPDDKDILFLCGDIILDDHIIGQVIHEFESYLRESGYSAVAAFEGIQSEKTAICWNRQSIITDYGDIDGHEEAGIFILHSDHRDTARDLWSSNRDEWFPIIFPEVPSKPIVIPRNNHLEINTRSDLVEARARLREHSLSIDAP